MSIKITSSQPGATERVIGSIKLGDPVNAAGKEFNKIMLGNNVLWEGGIKLDDIFETTVDWQHYQYTPANSPLHYQVYSNSVRIHSLKYSTNYGNTMSLDIVDVSKGAKRAYLQNFNGANASAGTNLRSSQIPTYSAPPPYNGLIFSGAGWYKFVFNGGVVVIYRYNVPINYADAAFSGGNNPTTRTMFAASYQGINMGAVAGNDWYSEGPAFLSQYTGMFADPIPLPLYSRANPYYMQQLPSTEPGKFYSTNKSPISGKVIETSTHFHVAICDLGNRTGTTKCTRGMFALKINKTTGNLDASFMYAKDNCEYWQMYAPGFGNKRKLVALQYTPQTTGGNSEILIFNLETFTHRTINYPVNNVILRDVNDNINNYCYIIARTSNFVSEKVSNNNYRVKIDTLLTRINNDDSNTNDTTTVAGWWSRTFGTNNKDTSITISTEALGTSGTTRANVARIKHSVIIPGGSNEGGGANNTFYIDLNFEGQPNFGQQGNAGAISTTTNIPVFTDMRKGPNGDGFNIPASMTISDLPKSNAVSGHILFDCTVKGISYTDCYIKKVDNETRLYKSDGSYFKVVNEASNVIKYVPGANGKLLLRVVQ